jgi:hypothetical protein
MYYTYANYAYSFTGNPTSEKVAKATTVSNYISAVA